MTFPFERPASPRATLPRLSVVVISTAPRALFERCMAATVAEYGRRAHEVIVARDACPSEVASLARRFRGVRFLALPGSTPLQLRAAGIGEAEGEVLALVRDVELPQHTPHLRSHLR